MSNELTLYGDSRIVALLRYVLILALGISLGWAEMQFLPNKLFGIINVFGQGNADLMVSNLIMAFVASFIACAGNLVIVCRKNQTDAAQHRHVLYTATNSAMMVSMIAFFTVMMLSTHNSML